MFADRPLLGPKRIAHIVELIPRTFQSTPLALDGDEVTGTVTCQGAQQ
jgi:hypothetical protein